MPISEKPATPDGARIERRPTRLAATADGLVLASAIRVGVVERITVAFWRMLHPLGAHRWRDGYEIDVERGWTQFRGSRCTICDEPWEGW